VRELRDKTAVVTGAGSRIGRALARRWANAGMRVVLAHVDDRTVTDASEEMNALGAEVLAVHCDVSVLEDVETLRDRALERFGQVNVVCNNAGVGSHGALIATTPIDDWRWTIGVNLWGVVHGVHASFPISKATGTVTSSTPARIPEGTTVPAVYDAEAGVRSSSVNGPV
jgi:NAD(P)-dependent dehydrogenase (short-subunit alcohol dehydrogenase family)